MSNRRRKQRTPSWRNQHHQATAGGGQEDEDDLAEFAASVAASVDAGRLSEEAGHLAVHLWGLGDFDLDDRAFDPGYNTDSAHLYIELRDAGLLEPPPD
jgi:hypothetical protein